MITRATILPGDAASPVVLHVPYCPPMSTEFTPQALLDGSLDTVADRIAKNARTQAARRPHVVLNRLPNYVEDAVPNAMTGERRRGHTMLCGHHAATIPADPYVTLVRRIVEERVAATTRVTVVEIRTASTPAATDDPRRITVAVDPDLTPRSLADAASAAFAGYDVDETTEPATTWPVPSTCGDASAIEAIAIDIHTGANTVIAPSAVVRLGRTFAALADRLIDDGLREN
ncbi:hypothetical protein [Gordonia hydrophobica]|uniref:Uncharacterized protein n=1 Tax=Gordonia hydrophobica TaxID=40516 RepID=A0ABZ2TY93_9ACTN|nr:hypothetical protein [Gordonia hydrophobica]MBM7366557.1 hypothetical protein [Gordonia hydrophobica]